MDIGKEEKEVVVVDPIEDPVPNRETEPEQEPVPVVKEETAAEIAHILSGDHSREAVVFLTVGITERDWRVIVSNADEDDLPALRKIRKLSNHRRWRRRNAQAERARHRAYYRSH